MIEEEEVSQQQQPLVQEEDDDTMILARGMVMAAEILENHAAMLCAALREERAGDLDRWWAQLIRERAHSLQLSSSLRARK